VARDLADTASQAGTSAPGANDILEALKKIPWVYADPVRLRHFEKLDELAAAKRLKITPPVFQARLKQGYELLEAELGVDFPQAFLGSMKS
jgi:DNA-directed RNA polymerase specialized sigma24 family protein